MYCVFDIAKVYFSELQKYTTRPQYEIGEKGRNHVETDSSNGLLSACWPNF